MQTTDRTASHCPTTGDTHSLRRGTAALHARSQAQLAGRAAGRSCASKRHFGCRRARHSMGRKGRARKSSKSGQKAARVRGATLGESTSAANPAVSNVFEKRTNKRLHTEALGRHVRGAQRNVALARGRAVARREQELIPEYLGEGRTNTFSDRRIGEGKTEVPMTQEEKALARFRKERKLQAAAVSRGKSKRKFNLGDEPDDDDDGEALTHFGQPLANKGEFDFRPEREGDDGGRE